MLALHVPVSGGGGDSSIWGDQIVLRDAPSFALTLDLTELDSADPLFLIRLKGVVDWHCAAGYAVKLVSPRRAGVRRYLERMHLAADLPGGCESDLSTLGAGAGNDVLIPIRRLRCAADAVTLDQELETLYLAHFRGKLGPLAEIFTRTIGEITDNATTHGESAGGAYVAAQRYSDDRCVFAIGDLGVGIPEHLRRAMPQLADDEAAIREATREGVSGTGDSTRGLGYQEVIDALKEAQVRFGELRVWSGCGRFRVETREGRQQRRRAWMVDNATRGAWVRVELAG